MTAYEKRLKKFWKDNPNLSPSGMRENYLKSEKKKSQSAAALKEEYRRGESKSKGI